MNKAKTLPNINKPARYIGHEHNTIIKDWHDTDIKTVLIFPDLYEIGMSHQGLQILYHIINNQEKFLAERCYCPDIDMEKLLDKNDEILSSLESNRPITDFDLIALTLPYELCYTNILTILNSAKIPFYSKDRDESFPIILGGGPCAFNPEPVADFFDAILVGDGEETIIKIANTIKTSRDTGLNKEQTLYELSRIQGVYIPSFFTPTYNENGRINNITAKYPEYTEVYRSVLSDLSKIDHLLNPLVPNGKIVHDRLGIEVARGCTRGCRFCQAGIIYRPARERTADQIMELATQGIANSGFDEMALLSLSTGDYSCLNQVLPKLMDKFAENYVSVSMPSMRVGTLTGPIMDQIKRVRKTGFTVAPEAGSERLRQVINKGITEENLLETARDAFSLGWNVIKLYFMVGLPTETDDDIDEIATLAKKTKKAISQFGGRKQITISVGTFVPKPHTPFQWETQISKDTSNEKISRLKQIIPRKGFKLKWHDSRQSYLEGVFSRGDRKLAKLIETAWKNGSRLDAWSDHYDLYDWIEAAEQCSISLEQYLKGFDLDDFLPWQHINCGVDTDFLKDELKKAKKHIYTPDCRYHACQKCGLCDFKEIKPIVHNKKRTNEEEYKAVVSQSYDGSTQKNTEPLHFKYHITYSRTGDITFLGHLEVLQLIFRVINRAGIKPNYSCGFNPSPKISFSPALPVGTISYAEYFILDVPKPFDDLEQIMGRLNQELPEGINITNIELNNKKIPQNIISNYRIDLNSSLTEDGQKKIAKFNKATELIITRIRKGKRKEINIVPLIQDLTIKNNNRIEFHVISKAGQAGVKPLDAISAILEQPPESIFCTITKLSWKEWN